MTSTDAVLLSDKLGDSERLKVTSFDSVEVAEVDIVAL